MTSRHPIPDAALAQHTAIVGKTGSGKTSTGKLAIEQVVAEGARVCILDPTKSDWWGLTSSADGKRAGLPFQILGGPRGHVPLHSSAGKAIGELVATGALPLSIIDMADFEPGGVPRFFVSFAEALLKKMRGVLYLVVEEAHEFAPKERAGFHSENMAIHWAKKLATAGRSKGVRLILLTQRTQSLHNALLGSCDTIIAHRLTAPADQKPIIDWLKGNADRGVTEMVSAQLASLKTGAAWLCSGEAKMFERVEFPRIKTYDNTKTPDHGDGEHHVTMAKVDLDKLRAAIGDAVKEAEANDPKVLNAEIVKLKADLAKKPTTSKVIEKIADPDSEHRGFMRGKIEGYGEAIKDIGATISALVKAIGQTRSALDACEKSAASMETWLDKAAEKKIDLQNAIKQSGSATVVPTAHTPDVARSPLRPTPRLPPPSSAPSGDGTLSSTQRETLAALAWWASVGHDQPTRKQLGSIIGVVPTSSTMRSRLAALTAPGFIEYPSPETVRLTDDGLVAAPQTPSFESVVDAIRANLNGKALATFDAIPSDGSYITREELGRSINVPHASSTMRSRLAPLSARELIEYQSANVRRQPWVTA